MTITDVIANIELAIRGKKLALNCAYSANVEVAAANHQVLMLNIKELQRIKADLEKIQQRT